MAFLPPTFLKLSLSLDFLLHSLPLPLLPTHLISQEWKQAIFKLGAIWWLEVGQEEVAAWNFHYFQIRTFNWAAASHFSHIAYLWSPLEDRTQDRGYILGIDFALCYMIDKYAFFCTHLDLLSIWRLKKDGSIACTLVHSLIWASACRGFIHSIYCTPLGNPTFPNLVYWFLIGLPCFFLFLSSLKL